MGSNAPNQPSPFTLGQLGRGQDPLLIPVAPGSSVEEIARLVRESGAPRVELLVPDATASLRSVDGTRALREAAAAAGVRLTIFTADDGIAGAAREASIDVHGVGARVAAPRPGSPRPAGGQRAPETPRLAAQQAPAPGGASSREAGAAPEQPRREAGRTAAPMPGAAADDREFLSRLDAFDHAAATPAAARDEPSMQEPQVQRSSEGALLFDAPGDEGVPRPEREARPAATRWTRVPAGTAAASAGPAEPQPATKPPRRSFLAALFGSPPARAPARETTATWTRGRSPKTAAVATVPAAHARAVPASKTAKRRRASPAWLLVPLLFAAGAVLLWLADVDLRGVAGRFVPSVAPQLVVAPPARATEAYQVSDVSVALTDQPVADPSSVEVQGIVLAAPVTVALEGSAATTALTPSGIATGTLLFSNPSSQAITIPAGTPVQANGLEFTFDQQVTVPGAVSDFAGTRNGQASASLTARLPGAQGNIPAGSITNVPGYTGGAGPLRVLQSQPFSGGSDTEVVVVTPDDVSRLLPDALSRLYARGVQDINTQLAAISGFELVQAEGTGGLPGSAVDASASSDRPTATAAISPTAEMLADVQPGEFEVFPAIGQVVAPELNGLFKLSMTRQFEALASPVNQPIDEQLRRAVANLQNRAGGDVTPEEVRITGWRRADNGLRVDAQITPRAGFVAVPAERAAEVAAAIRGRPSAEARQELDRMRDEGLIGPYRLPDDWDIVPEAVVVTFAAPSTPGTQP